MRRRTFLSLAAAAAAGETIGRLWPAAPAEAALPLFGDVDICRSGGPLLVGAREPGDGLHYEGTHILTYGALREVAARYRGPTPFIVRGGGCDNAVLGVRRGSADLGGMCCPPQGHRLEGMRSLVVARDIKVVVAHPECCLNEVTLPQLRAVAAGVIDDWRELGDGAGAIVLVVREHCGDYVEPVRTALLGRDPAWSRRALFVNTDEQVVDTVARFPRAMGVASWVFAKPFVEAGRLALLPVDGAAPIPEEVAAGRYPLVAPMSIIFRRWTPEMRPLFDFIYGPEGRAIIAERLVPVSAAEAGYA